MIYLFTDANHLSDKDAKILRALLSKERLEKLSKKKEDASAALLCYALFSLALGVPHISFAYEKHGRPSLLDFPALYISISHTQGAGIIGIGRSPIGVDIERTARPVSDRVFGRVATEEETLLLSGAPKKERIKLWTLKESYLKLKGTGITAPFHSVSFSALYPPVCSEDVTAFVGEAGGYTFSFCGQESHALRAVTASEAVAAAKRVLNLS